jgi:hypothetical protein
MAPVHTIPIRKPRAYADAPRNAILVQIWVSCNAVTLDVASHRIFHEDLAVLKTPCTTNTPPRDSRAPETACAPPVPLSAV